MWWAYINLHCVAVVLVLTLRNLRWGFFSNDSYSAYSTETCDNIIEIQHKSGLQHAYPQMVYTHNYNMYA